MPHTQLLTASQLPRRSHLTRTLRALWRDTNALWREFQRPFLAFIFALFGGGYLYGFLHNNVAQLSPPIPATNLPYTMLALMVLETPTEIPPHPYLIIFWYLMPAIGVYVVGQGAVDFVRLFFNRSGRQRAWEEALASTYRNHVIVLGIGHVGLRVVRALLVMGFEVITVDSRVKPEVAEELRGLHIPIITGDGRLPSILEAAGLRYARSMVICTSNDQVNLEVTMRARDLNPNVRIVVRMWDNQFAKQLNRFMGVEAVLSASDLAAPAFAGAAVGIEITQSLKVEGEDYSLIRLKVQADSFMDGQPIEHLQVANDMDIVLHERGGHVDVHPSGGTVVQAGDTLVIFAKHSQIIDLVARKRGITRSRL